MRAVFLDRDGVIIKNTELVTDYGNVLFEDSAAEAIRIFNALGLKVIVATNQPQIARGMCSESDVESINGKITEHFISEGASIDRIYFCPHHPEQHDDVPGHAKKYRVRCECRKPGTGMIRRAAEDYGIDIEKSFMVGDRTVDVMTGKNAGMKSILVETGRAGKDGKYGAQPDYVCKDVLAAANLIRRNLKTKAVILAGGRGERLMPLTKDVPKPMIEINGKPVLEHQISLLKKHGITDIVLCSSYLSEKITGYFGNGSRFGVGISYPKEDEPLGTGGAIKNAESFIGAAENIFVLNGDVMTKIDAGAVMDFHESRKCIATLVLRKTDHPLDSDIVEMDESCRVVKYVGRGQDVHRLGNTGIMVLDRKILGYIKPGVSNVEKDVIFKLLGSERVCGFVSDDYIRDMGTLERLEKVRREFSSIS